MPRFVRNKDLPSSKIDDSMNDKPNFKSEPRD